MNRENQNRLMDFPFGVATSGWDGKICLDENGEPYGFPCECLDGWADLIYNLCKELNDLYVANGWDVKEIEILQIKEKFGGLRFYTGGLIEGGHDIINKYEELSFETCEKCGTHGEVRDGRWIMTLCDECYKEI